MTAPALIDAKRTAAILGVSARTVHKLAAEGVLRPVRFGPRGRYRFAAEEVAALVQGSGQAAGRQAA